jgi:hypothetical protein
MTPSQGRYIHTEQHQHKINAHTDIRDLSGIRNYDPSVSANEDTIIVVVALIIAGTASLGVVLKPIVTS